MEVSFDCVSAGWGVLFILLLLSPSLGEAESSTSSTSQFLARFLVPLLPPMVLALDLGVTMHSSKEEQPASKVVGLGEGDQPSGLAALESRLDRGQRTGRYRADDWTEKVR